MATWVPAIERTPLWFVLKKHYRVSVNEMQYRGKEDIKRFGVVTTGIEELDSTVSKRLIHVMITPARMAELHNQDIVISLTSPGDAKEIYNNVQAHIKIWVEHMSHAYTTNNLPLDDLLMLDEFATTLFPHATRYFTDEIVSDLRNRIFGGNDRLSAFGKLGSWTPNPEEAAAQKKAAAKVNAPQRVGYADQFARAIRKRDYPRKY